MVATSSYFNQSPFGGNTSSWNTWGQNPGYFGSTNTQNNWGQDSGYTSGFKFDSPDYSSTFKKETPDPGNWLKAYTENMNLLGSNKEDKNKYRSSFDSFGIDNQNIGTRAGQQQTTFGSSNNGGSGQVLENLGVVQQSTPPPFTVAGMQYPQKPSVGSTLLRAGGLIASAAFPAAAGFILPATNAGASLLG